jgi:MFS family permease
VRGGLGPYLAIYLVTVRHWDAAEAGVALAASSIAGLLAQTPAGLLVDSWPRRRELMAGAALLVAAACLVVLVAPGFWPVVLSQAVAGAAEAVFAPGIAAITLGMVGERRFARRTGRNESFNHFGNAAVAIAAGLLSWNLGPVVVFWLLAAMAAASVVAVLAVPAGAIDPARARGLAQGHGREAPSGWGDLIADRRILAFAAAVLLFHFANAPMLPLVGQKLAASNPAQGTALVSLCIIVAQLVMVPMAMLAGARADRWGRKPLFLGGFAVLALRGLLYPFSDDSTWLVAVQCLDGVGAGLFGVLFPVIVADLAQGTGRFNAITGALSTAQGIGASAGNVAAGFVVVAASYGSAFLSLGGVAVCGALLFWRLVPETRVIQERSA